MTERITPAALVGDTPALVVDTREALAQELCGVCYDNGTAFDKHDDPHPCDHERGYRKLDRLIERGVLTTAEAHRKQIAREAPVRVARIEAVLDYAVAEIRAALTPKGPADDRLRG